MPSALRGEMPRQQGNGAEPRTEPEELRPVDFSDRVVVFPIDRFPARMCRAWEYGLRACGADAALQQRLWPLLPLQRGLFLAAREVRIVQPMASPDFSTNQVHRGCESAKGL